MVKNRVLHVGLSLVGLATAALIRSGTGLMRLACKPAEDRNGWPPSGYPKRT